MKKCPTCDKTYEDSMRFCQIDGTSLVDDAPAFDPYATIIGGGIPIPPAASADPLHERQEAEPVIHQTVGSLPIAPPNDVLDLPEADPMKTMYVSESEMQSVLEQKSSDEPEIIEIQPIEETPQPEEPSFSIPDVPAPNFGGSTPPPSPFSTPPQAEPEFPAYTEPVQAPSSFDEPARSTQYEEAATVMQPSYNSPFETPSSAPAAEWTPPPAPDSNWRNQEIGSNTPFQPPPAGVAGQNKTLPIISLVLGIMSLCCYVSPITGIAAVITGFLGMKNASNDPNTYGGKGLAIAGMATGGLFFLIGIIYWVFILFFGGMAMIMDSAR